MRTIRENAMLILQNIYDGVPHYGSFEKWAELEASNNPGFHRWLFNDQSVSDFGSNLTDEECSQIDKVWFEHVG